MIVEWQDLAKDDDLLTEVGKILSDKLFTAELVDSMVSGKDKDVIDCVKSFLPEDVLNDIADDIVSSNNECSRCGGSGGIPEYPCFQCGGSGESR